MAEAGIAVSENWSRSGPCHAKPLIALQCSIGAHDQLQAVGGDLDVIDVERRDLGAPPRPRECHQQERPVPHVDCPVTQPGGHGAHVAGLQLACFLAVATSNVRLIPAMVLRTIESCDGSS
jgi:hypothetical protein